MKKKLPLVFLGCCLVWWAALAGVTVVQHGRGVMTVVVTTTTTTTTIPPINLLVNGTFESNGAPWTVWGGGAVTYTNNQAVIVTVMDFGATLFQLPAVTNGWTYTATFGTSLGTSSGKSLSFKLGHNTLVSTTTDGLFTVTGVCGPAVEAPNGFALEYYSDNSSTFVVSNVSLYFVSAP